MKEKLKMDLIYKWNFNRIKIEKMIYNKFRLKLIKVK